MNEPALVAKLCAVVKTQMQQWLSTLSIDVISSVDAMEAKARSVATAVAKAFFGAWIQVLERMVKALAHVCTNWRRMQAARLKAMGVDFVSARAEAQVRDRTKRRFAGPGAWRQENLEGKATLRAIVAEGSWPHFRAYCLERSATEFQRQLRHRLDRAIAEGRLCPAATDTTTLTSSETLHKAA